MIYVQRSYRKPILRRIEPEFRVDRARRAASKALASEPGREARRLVGRYTTKWHFRLAVTRQLLRDASFSYCTFA